MTNHPVRGNAPAMSRRALLAALPFSGATMALPVAAERSGKTQVEEWFEKWWAVYAATEEASHEGLSREESDALTDRYVARQRELEARVLEAPTETARDLAMKVMVSTDAADPGIQDFRGDMQDQLIDLAIGRETYKAYRRRVDAIDAWDVRTKRQGEAVRMKEALTQTR